MKGFRYGSWVMGMSLFFMVFVASRPISLQEKYIEQFKYVAISEMKRTGVPASIKMAQALLESQSGQSILATSANNHFGIKCKSTWTGEIYYHKDDDLDSNGVLVESCFRSYSSAVDSYKDHSDFLVNRGRYKELFNLPKTDYVGWAHGLKKCGYATDPSYADRLVRIIQRYNLDLLDQEVVEEELILARRKAAVEENAEILIASLEKKPIAHFASEKKVVVKPVHPVAVTKKINTAKQVKGKGKSLRKTRI
jgi:hypothetical protein